MNIKNIITEYPNFPKKGILFRDISPILANPAALSHVVDEFSKLFHANDVDVFAGIESRGFPLACAMSLKYNKGMIMIRKQGKLPGSTVKKAYNIEYGKAVMEIQKNSIRSGQRVLICDDLLATGGTARAAAELVEKVGGKVTGLVFMVELTDLQGMKKLTKYRCESLVKY
ncbi:MAG TPA: adenine phosphoribosyltransferase [Candidatus Nitrosotenuis sp.]|nr:adenine phosphoribosyltransferase [Candidatus Nitrosotenuis sp.]